MPTTPKATPPAAAPIAGAGTRTSADSSQPVDDGLPDWRDFLEAHARATRKYSARLEVFRPGRRRNRRTRKVLRDADKAADRLPIAASRTEKIAALSLAHEALGKEALAETLCKAGAVFLAWKQTRARRADARSFDPAACAVACVLWDRARRIASQREELIFMACIGLAEGVALGHTLHTDAPGGGYGPH